MSDALTLTDQSVMQFGKYTGRALENVPADWLLWWWDDAHGWDKSEFVQRIGPPSKTIFRSALHDYIKRSFSALETECPDRIIQHRPR